MTQVTAQLLSPTGEVLAREVPMDLQVTRAPRAFHPLGGLRTWHGTLVLAPTPLFDPEAAIGGGTVTVRLNDGRRGTIRLTRATYTLQSGEWHLTFQGVGALTEEGGI